MTHATVAASPVATVRARERAGRCARTDRVLLLLSVAGPEEHGRLIDELIAANMPVAESIAARYRRRGIPDEDLEQVAYLALVRVARDYDPSRGRDFLAYAVPCIRGEVCRYFRDQGWMVRPPRWIQELQGRMVAVESALGTRLGHPPSARELAEELGEPVADVEEAMAANGCFIATSLDQITSSDKGTIADRLGASDPALEGVDARQALGPVVRRLSARERRILAMRFFGQCTQREISEEIGVTQMQVSRLLNGLLLRLRAELDAVSDRVPA